MRLQRPLHIPTVKEKLGIVETYSWLIKPVVVSEPALLPNPDSCLQEINVKPNAAKQMFLGVD